MAQCDGLATGQKRSHMQPHISVPSTAGMRDSRAPCVSYWLLLAFGLTIPLAAAPSTLSAQNRTQQRHNPAPAKVSARRPNCWCWPRAAAWPCNKAVRPCRSVLCKEIIQSMFCLNTPQQLWEDVISVSHISDKCFIKCLI